MVPAYQDVEEIPRVDDLVEREKETKAQKDRGQERRPLKYSHGGASIQGNAGLGRGLQTALSVVTSRQRISTAGSGSGSPVMEPEHLQDCSRLV